MITVGIYQRGTFFGLPAEKMESLALSGYITYDSFDHIYYLRKNNVNLTITSQVKTA